MKKAVIITEEGYNESATDACVEVTAGLAPIIGESEALSIVTLVICAIHDELFGKENEECI